MSSNWMTNAWGWLARVHARWLIQHTTAVAFQADASRSQATTEAVGSLNIAPSRTHKQSRDVTTCVVKIPEFTKWGTSHDGQQRFCTQAESCRFRQSLPANIAWRSSWRRAETAAHSSRQFRVSSNSGPAVRVAWSATVGLVWAPAAIRSLLVASRNDQFVGRRRLNEAVSCADPIRRDHMGSCKSDEQDRHQQTR